MPGSGPQLLLRASDAVAVLQATIAGATDPGASFAASLRCIAQLLADYAELKVTHREKSVTELRRQWIREEAAAAAAGEDTSSRIMPDFAAMISRDPLPRAVATEVAAVALARRLAEALELADELSAAAPTALAASAVAFGKKAAPPGVSGALAAGALLQSQTQQLRAQLAAAARLHAALQL